MSDTCEGNSDYIARQKLPEVVTMFMNIVRDISTVISRVTFSPESGGKLKPSTAMLRVVVRRHDYCVQFRHVHLDISTQGPMKFEK